MLRWRLLFLLSLPFGCGARDAHPSAQPTAARVEDAATLRALHESDRHSDVLFVRMRESAQKDGRWQLGTHHEGWGTTEIYCRDSTAGPKGCANPGVEQRHFMYGSAGAYVTVHEPARTGHWGMDASFGPQQLSIRFGRRELTGKVQPELEVGHYAFAVDRANQGVEIYAIDQGEHFARLTASPESFRDAVVEKLDLLGAQVRTQLREGEAVQLITGYDGCVPIQRPFDEREQAELVARADRDIARQKALVTQHFSELHALVTALIAP